MEIDSIIIEMKELPKKSELKELFSLYIKSYAQVYKGKHEHTEDNNGKYFLRLKWNLFRKRCNI